MAEFEDWASSPRHAVEMDASLAFESDVLKSAWQEWSRQAIAGVPHRSAFTPRNAKPFLPHLVIFERRDSTFLIRLMGTKVSAVIGEMQGRTIDEALPSDVATRWKTALSQVLHSGQPIRAVTAVGFRNLNYLQAEILLAPLLDDKEEQSMVFAVTVFRAGVSPDRSVEEIVAANNNAHCHAS